MNKVDLQHTELIKKILKNGHSKNDRTGVGTKSIFGYQMRFKMSDGFPLLTLRKIHTKSLIHEILWFLNAYDKKYHKFGNTNIRYLLENGVTFWSDWPLKNYNEHNEKIDQKSFEDKILSDDNFALQWGDLGPVYGHQWINSNGVNQIDKIIEQLKNDPDSRRMIVDSWNVAEIPYMMLPPCHFMFQFYSHQMNSESRFYEFSKWKHNYKIHYKDTMEQHNFPTRKLSLQLYIRSNDVGLGQPFNIAEYALLLHMIGQITNMVPYELIYTIGDAHVYNNHIEQLNKMNERFSYDLPTLTLNREIESIYDFRFEDIHINNYKSHSNIRMEVAV
jgi:thymidylate synthase